MPQGSTPTVQVAIQTNPAGLAFSVDGTTYSSTQTFSWASGSSHTIATTSPQNGATGVRYVWTNWSDGGAISHSVAPTTNKTYTATFKTQYYLTMTHGTDGTVSPNSGWRNSGGTGLNHGNAIHGLQLQQLGRHWDRLLFGHDQSWFKHNGRAHHGGSYFHS